MAVSGERKRKHAALFGGAVVLCLVIILGISAATSLLIERQRLFALADSAALAGAESFDPARLSLAPSGIQAPLDSSRVAAAVRNFLSRADSAGLDSLALEAAHTPGWPTCRGPIVLDVGSTDGLRIFPILAQNQCHRAVASLYLLSVS